MIELKSDKSLLGLLCLRCEYDKSHHILCNEHVKTKSSGYSKFASYKNISFTAEHFYNVK